MTASTSLEWASTGWPRCAQQLIIAPRGQPVSSTQLERYVARPTIFAILTREHTAWQISQQLSTMTPFEHKKTEALRLLEATGIRRANYLPQATRLLWRFGLEVPPPHFMKFGKVAVLFGAFFGLGWGGIMYLLLGIRGPLPSVLPLALASGCGGLLFGVFMAMYYSLGRKRHRLPSWEAIGTTNGAA